MYDIDQLEKQWERYKRKKRKPYYKLLFILILTGSFTVLLYLNKELILKEIAKQTEPKVSHNKHTVFREKAINKLSVKNDKEKIPPSSVVDENNPMYPEDVLPEIRENNTKKVSFAVSEKQIKPRKKIHFEITEMTGEKAYTDIKNRFELAPDPDDSLFLARNYFKDGKYNKAAYWALQTNKLNGDIEESWLIFAESKAKTGKKNEAIRVLSKYAEKSGSQKAYKLLKKLKR